MNVFIITEGSSHIGFGHITRCISLCDVFEEKSISPTFIIHGDDSISPLLRGRKSIIFNWIEKKESLFDLIKNADIAVVDSYLADITFYNQISETAKIPVYIDDTKRINYPRGIVVNGTIYADELNYPKKEGVTYLLGSQYIPIRKEFWNIPEKEIRESIKTVMITFGGNDMRNLTPKVLRIINKNFPEYTKKVVIGKGFNNIKQIESSKDETTELVYFPDADEMKEVMLETDIVISAGGQTLYELARVGVPTIAIALSDNQMNNIKGCQKAGFIEYAGWWEDKELFSNIMQKFEFLKNIDVRKEKEKTGKILVDGLGAIRIAKYCIKKYLDKDFILRKAEMKDMFDIYELSNDLDVRKNSFSPDKIELENHRIWFLSKLKSENCFFLVAEIDNSFIGQVRFDINDSEAIISISIMKQYRGLGLGKLITQRALKLFLLENPCILYVKAYVKKGNMHSARLFESTGFQFVKETTIKGQDALEYLYQFKKL